MLDITGILMRLLELYPKRDLSPIGDNEPFRMQHGDELLLVKESECTKPVGDSASTGCTEQDI